jgi:hypothetical protein
MIYNEAITYNSPNVSYDGTLIIYASSLINPIVLNNITIFYTSSEDYSNLTTIGVLSIDINPQGVVSVEVLDKDISAISSAQVISIGVNGEISIISGDNESAIYSNQTMSADVTGEISIIG